MGLRNTTPASRSASAIPTAPSYPRSLRCKSNLIAVLLLSFLCLFVVVELGTHAVNRQRRVILVLSSPAVVRAVLATQTALASQQPTPLPTFSSPLATAAQTHPSPLPPSSPSDSDEVSTEEPLFKVFPPIPKETRDAISFEASTNYRYTNGKLVRFSDTIGVRAVHQANETSRALKAVVVSVISAPVKVLEGPLCVFVPSNAPDDVHLAELHAGQATWMDKSTLLFTEAYLNVNNITMAKASLDEWNALHEEIILSQPRLKHRVTHASQLKGRGQLSIPLFHWISQLVKRDDPLVQNCKWFMKCDTDTYLRRGLLEREVLNKLDHTKPYHVGVPLHFDIRPYHRTERKIEFDYHIGGPGYTFSRALMQQVDVDACVRSMTLDPVLLIHDDVATGYCATYHVMNSARVQLRTAVSSTSSKFLLRWLTNNATADSILRFTTDSVCVKQFTSIHPVTPNLAYLLHSVDSAREDVSSTLTSDCEATVIVGAPARIGPRWSIESDNLKELLASWELLWREKRLQAGTNLAHVEELRRKFFA